MGTNQTLMFLGDVCCSPYGSSVFKDPVAQLFAGKFTVVNLEGAIGSVDRAALDRKVVFNDPRVLSVLQAYNVHLASLANNHMFDVAECPKATQAFLARHGILSCGAGGNLAEASAPVVSSWGGEEMLFLAFGWEVIGCRVARKNGAGVNPLVPGHVLDWVRKAEEAHPNAKIVLLMHWDYELELYPQPMHRQLAFAAIDAGANAVIGCHSHCAQGIEVYRGSPVVYGLGNWFFSRNVFFGGRLSFPPLASLQLAFEWNARSKEMVCHWFRHEQDERPLSYLESSPVADCARTRALTPFEGMSHAEYVGWFGEHRRKRKGLPVYKNMNASYANWSRDRWVALRARLINLIFLLRLKGGPR